MTIQTNSEDEVGKQFDFSGGWLCLDFCNTADGDVNQSWTENLRSYADLLAWSLQAGSISDDEALHLRDESAQQPQQTEAVYQEAIRLRWTLYHIFSTTAHEQEFSPDALDELNTLLRQALEHRPVARRGDAYQYIWDSSFDPLQRPLWPIIWSASELLTAKDKLSLVRECGGPTCSWLFLDTSRNHSRRWCDMKGCGNRAKARRYYQRNKSDN